MIKKLVSKKIAIKSYKKALDGSDLDRRATDGRLAGVRRRYFWISVPPGEVKEGNKQAYNPLQGLLREGYIYVISARPWPKARRIFDYCI